MADVSLLEPKVMDEVADLESEERGEVEELEYEDTAAGNSTVWVGFMDIVPVIGPVKESVEFVLAVYENNEKVIKEKEKALETFLKDPFKKRIRVTQTQYKPAADATEFSGLLNVKEVAKAKLVEHTKKGSKITNLSANEKKARANKIEKIRKDVEEKLKSIGQPLNEELKEEVMRSKKGEHVFNNNILKFHSKVLNNFIEKCLIEKLQGYNKQTLDELGTHTLLSDTEKDIQYKMVVDFDPDEFYVNSNAILYGVYSKVLHEAFLNVLCHIDPCAHTEKEKDWLKQIILFMNEYKIYVDEFAKQKWISNLEQNKKRFEEVRKQVAEMYRTDRGPDWCTDIMTVVAPWFNTSM